MATKENILDETLTEVASEEPTVEVEPITDVPSAVEGDTKSRMYLLSALSENGTEALLELTEMLKGIGSTVEKSEDMGMRKLYFPINKRRELQLVSVFFKTTGEGLRELRAELLHSELIARYLITDWKAGLNETGNKRVKKEVTADV